MNPDTNLIIGLNSQLGIYFRDYFNVKGMPYVSVSAHDYEQNERFSKLKWNEVYLCFGESRKYIDDTVQYDHVNYELTKWYIDSYKKLSNDVYVYSTCELWNEYSGPISVSDSWNHCKTEYLNSKRKLAQHIIDQKKDYSNVHIQYPFNFNSPYRSNEFLFGKIFDSILNKKIVEVGNINFYRDIIHPRFVVEKTINSKKDQLIGSGRLTYVADFINDIYQSFDITANDYIKCNKNFYKEYQVIKEYYLKSDTCQYSYDALVKDTISDLNKMKRI